MDLSLHIREAFGNLAASKLRSFLAILGILVGTGSVVAMVSCGQLATKQALAEFEQLGTDLMSVSISQQRFDDDEGGSSGRAKEAFTLEDVSKMKQRVPEIRLIAPYTTAYSPLYFNGDEIDGSVIGVTSSLQHVIDIRMLMGRFISDFDGYTPYCVIGDDIYKELKRRGYKNPIGTQVQIGKEFFTIIGVAKHWTENSFFNQNINSSVIIPLQASTLLSKYATINNIVIRLNKEEGKDPDIDVAQDNMKQFIESEVPGFRLFFRSSKQLIDSMTKQKQTLTIMLGMIGSISLFVGGIGVMNIMLVSVVERKREIGIRKAVGAKQRDIQTLFLIESITLSLFGGILGIIFGVGASFIIAIFANWDFVLFLLPPIVGFSVSVAIGVFFGFYPAYQASRLDPIQTLRSD